jgi:hypothetical protein
LRAGKRKGDVDPEESSREACLKYVHTPVNEEIKSIGGYYKVLEEGVLDVDGKKVLYSLKAAHVDNSCCGAGGMGFLSVPGYLVTYKSEKNEEGHSISEVKHIVNKEPQAHVREQLKKKYPYINVIEFD